MQRRCAENIEYQGLSGYRQCVKYQIVQDFSVICENRTGEFSISTDSLIKDKRIRICVIDIDSPKYEFPIIYVHNLKVMSSFDSLLLDQDDTLFWRGANLLP